MERHKDIDDIYDIDDIEDEFNIFEWLDYIHLHSNKNKTAKITEGHIKRITIPSNWLNDFLELIALESDFNSKFNTNLTVCTDNVYPMILENNYISYHYQIGLKTLNNIRIINPEYYVYLAIGIDPKYYQPANLLWIKATRDINDNYNITIPEDYQFNPIFSDEIQNCSQSIILISLPVSTHFKDAPDYVYAHACILIINKETKEFEFYDPMGTIGRHPSNIRKSQAIIEWINTSFRSKAGLYTYTFIDVSNACPLGIQHYAENDIISELDKGFCGIYILMYVHMRLKNPSLDRNEINQRLMSLKPGILVRYVHMYTNLLINLFDWPVQ